MFSSVLVRVKKKSIISAPNMLPSNPERTTVSELLQLCPHSCFCQSFTQSCFSLPQDMEALKRSLTLIESKMGQAKSWLKDPHGQPGDRTFLCWTETHSLLFYFFNIILQSHAVLCPRRPQETPARSPCVWSWMRLVRWGSCALGRRGKTFWLLPKLWDRWPTRSQISGSGRNFLLELWVWCCGILFSWNQKEPWLENWGNKHLIYPGSQ